MDRGASSRLLIAARSEGLDALALSHAVLRAVWAEERDISDWDTLEDVSQRAGLNGAALVRLAKEPAVERLYRQDTLRAVDAQVFGSPTFVVDGERFWGQDRLDFLAERLSDAVSWK